MPANPNNLLARNVRALRLARGWSQEIMAEKCGLHRTYVGAIERGERNVTLETLNALALALGVSAQNSLLILNVDAVADTLPEQLLQRIAQVKNKRARVVLDTIA